MKRKTGKIFLIIGIIFILIVGVCFGGYFAIDRILVPKYFSSYGINNLKELVDIVNTMYQIPNEKDFIQNPFAKSDAASASNKLIIAGFPTLANADIDYEKIGKMDYTLTPSDDFTDNYIYLTDKEVASILDKILESGILVTNFPRLSYIDTLGMSVKQVTINPLIIPQNNTYTYSSTDASLSITIKLDTATARKQISDNLQVPQFLIDLIIPDILYITSTFDTSMDENLERYICNSELAVNSKTPKQSEVLLKLLISFIYNEKEPMSIHNLTNQLGELLIQGLNTIGNFEYKTDKLVNSKGVKIFLDI